MLHAYFVDVEKPGRKRKLKATLLPPPIFDTRLILKKGENGFVPFDRLSSGERQFAYTISNFLYHLVNIDSAWNDYYKDHNHAEVVKYHYVNVIFDEVELYFHPDMQRRFMSSLMDALHSVRFSEHLRGINIMLATHSPFILSDIPQSNILCLGEQNYSIDYAFGANILSLLSKGFFMESSFGEFAKKEIEAIVDMYYSVLNGGKAISEYKNSRARFKYVEQYVSDPILKDMVTRMLSELDNLKRNQNV